MLVNISLYIPSRDSSCGFKQKTQLVKVTGERVQRNTTGKPMLVMSPISQNDLNGGGNIISICMKRFKLNLISQDQQFGLTKNQKSVLYSLNTLD